MRFIVQSNFDLLVRYVLSVTFCGAVVLKVPIIITINLSFMQHSLQDFFFRKSFLRENPWVEITFELLSYGIEYRGTSHGTFGCLPFTKSFWEIWLETKWKLKRLFGSFQQKISRSEGTSEKVVVAFGRN